MNPWYQRTEFWLTAASGAASALGYFPKYAGIGAIISYIIGRSAVKTAAEL
jgi:hypothetical protein